MVKETTEMAMETETARATVMEMAMEKVMGNMAIKRNPDKK
jgi:hypothetical protein